MAQTLFTLAIAQVQVLGRGTGIEVRHDLHAQALCLSSQDPRFKPLCQNDGDDDNDDDHDDDNDNDDDE